MKPLYSIFVLVLIPGLSLGLMACAGNAGNTNNVPGVSGNSPTSTAVDSRASNSATKTAYPQTVVNEFLKSCQAAGSEAVFCGCVLDKVQNKYSLEEFSVIESKINAGSPPEEFVEFTGRARAECTR